MDGDFRKKFDVYFRNIVNGIDVNYFKLKSCKILKVIVIIQLYYFFILYFLCYLCIKKFFVCIIKCILYFFYVIIYTLTY